MGRYSDFWLTTSDGLRVYARDYDGSSRLPVLCLHGLTRNAADFEPLAESLAPRHRVVVMEQRGRGRSDYDPVPSRYQPGTYVADTRALIDALELERPVLIGTSMGGLISMILASADPRRVRGIVLNDIGPVVEAAGLARIRGYVGRSGPVASWDEAVRIARANNEAAFPGLSDAEWLTFARRLYRETAAGSLEPAYDTAIAEPIGSAVEAAVPADLWSVFETLRDVPMLVIRGGLSDILSAATVAEMARRHPGLQSVEIADRGHAPLLDEPVSVTAIERFLGGL